MRVLLINAPATWRQSQNINNYVPKIPLGLAYIGGVLRQWGHDVKILDPTAFINQRSKNENGTVTFGNFNKIELDLMNYQPEYVGISCIFSSRFLNTLKIAEIAKRVVPNCKTVVGGVHPTIAPVDFLESKFVDYVALGEADFFFMDLFNNLEECMDGIGYKKDGKIIINPKTKYIQELDILPFPARDLLPMEEYLKAEPYIRATGQPTKRLIPRNSIVTSRSCPYQCNFCVANCIWGQGWRPRKPEYVIKEMKQCIEDFGFTQFSFEDDNISIDRKRFKNLLDLIKDELPSIRWDTPNGIEVTTLDESTLQLMKESGCTTINLAVESADEEMLKVIGKPFYKKRLQKAEEVTAICKDLGINVLTFFIIGTPGETKESIQRSIDYAVKNKFDEINVSIVTPYPGTRLYNNCNKKGWLTDPLFYKKFSADDDYHQLTAIIDTPYLSAEDLNKERLRFYKEFNEKVDYARGT